MKKKLVPLPPEAAEIKVGELYSHYKGGTYIVKGVGRHSETLDPLVWYKNLEHGSEWGRPLSEWVKPLPDGSPRFVRINSVEAGLPAPFVAIVGKIVKAVGKKIKIVSSNDISRPTREVAVNPLIPMVYFMPRYIMRSAKETQDTMIAGIKQEIKAGATMMTKPMVLPADCAHQGIPCKGFVVFVEVA